MNNKQGEAVTPSPFKYCNLYCIVRGKLKRSLSELKMATDGDDFENRSEHLEQAISSLEKLSYILQRESERRAEEGERLYQESIREPYEAEN